MVFGIGSVVGFVVALLAGGLAIYVAASVVVDVDDYGHAVVTALVGAIAWAVMSSIWVIGPIVALIAWIGVINWRYPGGWITAAVIGVVAWLAAIAILIVLNIVGLGVGAFGIPGV